MWYNLGTKFTDQIRKSTDHDEKLDLLQKGLSDAVEKFALIAFERADVNDLITNDPKFKHFQFIKPDNMFVTETDPIHSAKIMSMISNLQETVVTLLSKKDKNSVQNDQVERLEKVLFSTDYETNLTVIS